MSSRLNHFLKWSQRRWEWLITSPSAQDPWQHNRARLLAGLLLVLILLDVLAIVLTVLAGPAYPYLGSPLVALLLLGGAFILQRREYFKLAVAFLLGAVFLAVVSSILAEPLDYQLAFLMTGVLISSLFLGIRLTVGVYIGTLLLLLVLYMLPLGLSLDGVLGAIMGSTLVLVLATLSTLDNQRHLRQTELKAQELAESEARYRALSLEYQQIAAEVRQLNAHLEQRVQERTTALEESRRDLESALARTNVLIEGMQSAEAALTRKAEELERSNTDLERFAYVASHDLQEPLRMVISYLQLLEMRYRGQLDADADEFIGFAVSGARRMQQLVLDLLEYSRVDSRGQPPQPIAATKALDQAVTNLRLAIQDTGATVTWDPLPMVTADPTQLAQLFQNLLGNAIKFRSAEPPRVHVSAIKMAENTDEAPVWQFSVRDNGIGIDPRYFDRIFGIFERLHARDEYPGTGIGLAVCQRIVERHGGRIWVESAVGQGSTFHFTLPE